MTNETELKKKELERLLKEKKIELAQYLEMLTKLETSPSLNKKGSSTSEKPKRYTLLKTDVLLFASPFLILVGWFIVGINPVQGYQDILSQYSTVGYPYSLFGTGIMMVATILLCVGLTYRFVKSVSRGGLISSQVAGWVFLIMAIYILATGFSGVWVQDTPTSWHNVAFISPPISGFGLLFWFIGTLTIAYGLVPSRKWLNKNIS